MSARWQVRRFDRRRPQRHPAEPGPCVVLDNIRSAFNVGSVFRTCEAAGTAHLYLCGISAAPPNPRVLKTSLGAEAVLPWSHHLSSTEVIENLRRQGIAIISVELTDRSQPYTAVDYPPRCALVFGHEVAGVAVPILERSDLVVEIPMLGRKNSLNVATSVGVVLFELVRRRG
ncbi:MAG: RNA methyltransferase [Deltaproteobacteria bacterium]|nr:RNA methyltransferase [Deltaproteobacteria bacterium]